MDIALELAQSAVKACAADNYNVSAAVVDRAGVLRALLRADNAGVHTPDSARRKAYTAVSLRAPTSAIAKNIQDNPAAAQLVAVDGFLILAGGVPVKIGNETIGAIGVGGAPGGNLDEACALAAIKQVEGKLK
ncbi:heme-binding protein [Mesorhizobium sp.]|uniref:GlcG/HbpS family heme-binding protein n=1 Tax=Mesorhizobium sp. TaxID=1871066 RepID=UPI0025CF0115|nr:heme-binding protein [Mesorhizobium sp.]